MNKEIMMFGDIEIDNLDVDKMILSNKVSFTKQGFKLFIGYKNLTIMQNPSKMSGYAKSSES